MARAFLLGDGGSYEILFQLFLKGGFGVSDPCHRPPHTQFATAVIFDMEGLTCSSSRVAAFTMQVEKGLL
jgi:hypothetical protein